MPKADEEEKLSTLSKMAVLTAEGALVAYVAPAFLNATLGSVPGLSATAGIGVAASSGFPFTMIGAAILGTGAYLWATIKPIPGAVAVPAVKEHSWMVPVGRTERGKWIFHNLAGDSPHMLCAGVTGSGKSRFVIYMLHVLCQQQGPDELEIVFIDLKRKATFHDGWLQLPHVLSIAGKPDEAFNALCDTRDEMNRRLDIIQECRGQFGPVPKFPRRVVIIDEASLIADDKDTMRVVRDIASVSREARIHLLYCAQRPSNVILPLETRDQFGVRFCFKVDEEGTSEIMLGDRHTEACDMPVHPGRMVMKTPLGGRLRIQTPFVDDDTLEEWLKSFGQRPAQRGVSRIIDAEYIDVQHRGKEYRVDNMTRGHDKGGRSSSSDTAPEWG